MDKIENLAHDDFKAALDLLNPHVNGLAFVCNKDEREAAAKIALTINEQIRAEFTECAEFQVVMLAQMMIGVSLIRAAAEVLKTSENKLKNQKTTEG